MRWLICPVSELSSRAGSAVVLMAALVLPLGLARAGVPDYKLGDVAAEDVVTPVPLVVINPEATEALKEKVASQAPSIVRFTVTSVAEAEAELRASVAATRTKFLTAFQAALQDRAPIESDIGTPAYTAALEYAARDAAKNLPLEKLVGLWIRGQTDQPFVEGLLEPVREVMGEPIVGVSKTDLPLPDSRPVRLIPVKSLTEPVPVTTLEAPGQLITPSKLISLWRAQRMVERHFPAGQELLGQFAATFVRPNAFYDPALTELVRAKRTVSLAVNDSFEAAQVIVHKGQTIDRRALTALAVLREKSLIGALQSKLDQEQSVAGQIKGQTIWMTSGLGLTVVALALIFWRLRSRPSTALVATGTNAEFPGAEGAGFGGEAATDSWQGRAIAAERKAERAFAAIRSGTLGWMRDKIFRTMFTQRAELLSAQQKAANEMRELEQRLEQLHKPLQERISTYEKRIAELETELAGKLRAQNEAPPRTVQVIQEEPDRYSRLLEASLAERERAIGDNEARLAERARDLAEMDALLRAREALLASARFRHPDSRKITIRGIDALNN